MVFLMAVLLASPAQACSGKAELQAKAKVSCEEARKTALAKLGGKGLKVKSAELEEEEGKVVYSFDVKSKGKSGVDEVQIDARTGEVASVKHESPKDEAREKD